MSDLELYYNQIKEIILDRQHPISGLLPASTDNNIHGNYTDAWVRDNVYSILCVWALSLAMRGRENYSTERYELEQATIRLMRGILRSMMQQSDKVENFKSSLALHHALHAKYDTATGNTVVGDHQWGHLQIDATSLYLIVLAQMTESGLPLIVNKDEVAFIQNLIFYIERAYRTPDYGIWERGEKSNVGYVELNASSVGMARSALRALTGYNLFGKSGKSDTEIHVLPDNLALCDITLQSLLPRESNTKEIDAALLSICGYPAFAVKDIRLKNTVKGEIRQKLNGKYGYKRFLRDGHQTVLEDTARHYYNEEELKQFEHIECEWPLFFTFEMILAAFENNIPLMNYFDACLKRVSIEKNGKRLLPELYLVPMESIESEKKDPGSQPRISNKNIPLVWAQSLYYMGSLLKDQWITPRDLDPLGLSLEEPANPLPIQILFLAESESLKQKLLLHNISTETAEDLPVGTVVCTPDIIAGLYEGVGVSSNLRLSGRPKRRIKSLTTSRLYHTKHNQLLCLSLFFLEKEFYLVYDSKFLFDRFHHELTYIRRHWYYPQKPLLTVMLTENLISRGLSDFKNFYREVCSGNIDGIALETGNYVQLAKDARIEKLPDHAGLKTYQENSKSGRMETWRLIIAEDISPMEQQAEWDLDRNQNLETLVERLRTGSNIHEHIRILNKLAFQYSLDHVIDLASEKVAIRDLLEELYNHAGKVRIWSVAREAAALLEKVDIDLQMSVTTLLVHQKVIQIGKAFTDESLVIRPIPFEELKSKIQKFCRDDYRDKVLTQEILVFLALLIRSKPYLFKELYTLRISYIILLITGEVARKNQLSQEDAYEELLHLPPTEIQMLLEGIMERYTQAGKYLEKLESLHLRKPLASLNIKHTTETKLEIDKPEEGWLIWRKSQGTLLKTNEEFYSKIWQILSQSKGIIIGDKLDRRNKLESRIILSDMTPGERAFEWRVEYLLHKINAPEYRQLSMECLAVIALFAEQNPDLHLEDFVSCDVIIGHAVRIAFISENPDLTSDYQDRKADAWSYFYNLSPEATSGYLLDSIVHLLQGIEKEL